MFRFSQRNEAIFRLCREFSICSQRQNNLAVSELLFWFAAGATACSAFWIFEIWPQWSNSYIVFQVFEILICSWGQNYPGVLKFWGFDLELRSEWCSCSEVLNFWFAAGATEIEKFWRFEVSIFSSGHNNAAVLRFEVFRFLFGAGATLTKQFWSFWDQDCAAVWTAVHSSSIFWVFFARSCLGKVPDRAPFSQLSKRATACTIWMQIVKQINENELDIRKRITNEGNSNFK